MIVFHPYKIRNIILIVFFFGVVLGAINITNNFEQTKSELTLFYATPFDTCVVTKLERRKYPGRGDYSIFYTDCGSSYFPVLLDKDNITDSYNLFKENVKLVKATNSVDLTLTDNDKVAHRLKIRRPEDEDDRKFSTKMILIIMGIGIAINLLLPNYLFEMLDA
jgi:hypothetical protein